ncbi:MAG: PAQR family membrane homeostasis protein TrhA [Acidimicrobiales bacterium]
MDPGSPRPVLRGHLHAVMFLVTIPAGALLLSGADRAVERVATAMYAASLVAVFGASAGYHILARRPHTRAIMQRVDHAMIYLLIAGTYTPVCLIALPRQWGVPILALVAAGGAAGAIVKLTAFSTLGRYASALYLVLGWAAVAAGPALVDALTRNQLTLLALGGVTYTIGFPVLMLRRPDPWPRFFGYHEIWHLFTVVAAVAHFGLVASLL